MIKGEVEEITLNMYPEEIESLVSQCHKSEIVNIMNKEYIIVSANCNTPNRFEFSGKYKTRATIKVKEIKTGN